MKPAQDFLSDAYAHAKFIGYTGAAKPLFTSTGLSDKVDDGLIELSDAAAFLKSCRALRFWERMKM